MHLFAYRKLYRVMPISTRVLLRQFARAVTSDHLLGDELSRAILDLTQTDGNGADHVDTFRAFLQGWREISGATTKPRTFTDEALVFGMGPPPGPALLGVLLLDIIGLPLNEVSTIFDQPEDALRDEVEALRSKMTIPSGCNILIVEDETFIAADMVRIVRTLGQPTIENTNTVDNAIKAAAVSNPDLIIADYYLSDEANGMDAVLEIRKSHECPVIFVTGFPEKALSGREFEPDFVIDKPFSENAVRTAVWHCLSGDG